MAEPASKKAKPAYTFNVNKCTLARRLWYPLCAYNCFHLGLDKEFEGKSFA